MSATRSFGRGISKGLLSVCLLLLPFAFFFTFVIAQPEVVKETVHRTGTYAFFSREATNAAVSAVEASSNAAGIPKEVVVRATEKAFPSSDMQMKGEKIIDNSYAWLNGQTSKLDVHVDIEKNKQILSQELKQEAIRVIENKPVCSYRELVSFNTADPAALLRLPCRPEGIDSSNIITDYFAVVPVEVTQQVESAAARSPLSEFSRENTQDTALNQEVSKSVPGIFFLLKNSFYIVITFLIVTLLVLYILIRDWREYFKGLTFPLVLNGILLFIYSAFAQWSLKQGVLSQLSSGISGEIVNRIFPPFVTMSVWINIWTGIIYIVLGIIFYGLYRVMKGRGIAEERARLYNKF